MSGMHTDPHRLLRRPFCLCDVMLQPVVLQVLLSAVLLTHVSSSPACASEDAASKPLRSLVVKPDPAGGVRATATLLFPGGPPLLQSILTDYQRWPELFETRMRLANLEDHAGRVT